MSDLGFAPPAFYAAWTPALLLTSATNRVSPAEFVIAAGGFDWPVVTMAIAAIGVLAARPLAPKRTPALSFWKGALVTLIMLVVALLWVLDTRPGLLFAFVVSIGLGFSGYTVIELMGEQISEAVKRIFDALPIPGRKASPSDIPDEDKA